MQIEKESKTKNHNIYLALPLIFSVLFMLIWLVSTRGDIQSIVGFSGSLNNDFQLPVKILDPFAQSLFSQSNFLFLLPLTLLLVITSLKPDLIARWLAFLKSSKLQSNRTNAFAAVSKGKDKQDQKGKRKSELPTRSERSDLLKIYALGLKLFKDVNLDLIARSSFGLTPIDLQDLCLQAGNNADSRSEGLIRMADFEDALADLFSHNQNVALINDNEREVAAIHNAGHILASWLIPHADSLKSISLFTQCNTFDWDAIKDRKVIKSHSALLADLDVTLAGRAAEEVVLAEASTYSEIDLLQATHLARSMITRWALGQGRLMVSCDDSSKENNEIGKPYHYTSSQKRLNIIEGEVQTLLEQRYLKVKQLLGDNASKLDKLTNKLLFEEKLNFSEIAAVLSEMSIVSNITPKTEMIDVSNRVSKVEKQVSYF